MLNWMLLLATLVGHVGIWVAAYNQMNSHDLPRLAKKIIEKFMLLAIVAFGILFVASRFPYGPLKPLALEGIPASALGGYAISCWIFAGFVTLRWAAWKVLPDQPAFVSQLERTRLRMADEIGFLPAADWITRAFARLPQNQLFELEVARKEFSLKQLPSSMDGLKVAHLSDLHMTGHVSREYFEEIVRQTNRFQPDLIVITGDLIDKAKCLPWLEPVFGKLKARLGVHYVLGNHDRRIKDEKLLRKHLKQAGLTAVNGRWHAVPVANGKLWLTGNELPWYRGAEKLAKRPPQFDEHRDMIVLLSHSPDQIAWANKRQIPLMLAGHTHGGQIRIPVLGPLVSPSRFGVKYASGVFQVGPTALHVSRGLGGVHPVRFNCTPELALLTLRSAATHQHQVDRQRTGIKESQHTEDDLERELDSTSEAANRQESPGASATGAA